MYLLVLALFAQAATVGSLRLHGAISRVPHISRAVMQWGADFQSDPFPVARVRDDCPSVTTQIHFNNAGASVCPRPVFERVVRHLEREAEVGAYLAAEEAEEELEGVYDSVAELLHCDRSEIALCESASAAWAKIFYTAALTLREGDVILTVNAEYAANFVAALQVAERYNSTVRVIPNDSAGRADVAAFRKMLEDDNGRQIKIVLLCHVPTNGGVVNPAYEFGRVLEEVHPDASRRPIFILDACQSAGQIPLDVTRLKCDALAATGRKYLRGPRGTGFLYCKRDTMKALPAPAVIDHFGAAWTSATEFTPRDDARRFEMWESSIANRLGLGVAVRYALAIGIDRIEHRIRALAADLRSSMESPDFRESLQVVDLGDESSRCGIVSVVVLQSTGMSAKDLRAKLVARNIHVAVAPASSTRLDSELRGLPDLLRVSVHYYNTEDEVRRFCAALKEILADRLC